ncbi:MAG TPA: cupin domain-containing protein [Baekduia sp.]|uniref:cupin domain-containing protein n=1 Tax=Baekduia sp. TaxID=2600305 RepID=UPI002D77127B|nr:cupin domain-containing protein [Baekduia sp.]HET6507719.1 cupin domain-containing protein [Baekduia sp.]
MSAAVDPAEPWKLSVADAVLDADELDPTTVLAGDPATSSKELWTSHDGTVQHGIWQLTPGTVTDVEADELFVVLSGSATIAFEDGPVLEVGPGDVVKLPEGARTVWTVHETLRKIYAIVS